MQRLEVSGAVRPIYGSLGVKRLTYVRMHVTILRMCGESEVIAAHTHTHTHRHTHRHTHTHSVCVSKISLALGSLLASTNNHGS